METQYSSALHVSKNEAQIGSLSGDIPLHLHNYHRLERLAIVTARSDWCGGTAVEHVVDNGCIHPIYGGLTSLAIPECLPDRLPIVSYANELFTLLGDCLEACREAQKIQAIVSDVVEILSHDQSLGGRDQQGLGLLESNRKSLVSMVNKMIEVDPERAETTFRLWSQHFEQLNAITDNVPRTIDDYLAWSIQRFEWWRPLLLFGCGITISPNEEPSLIRLSYHAFSAIALTTDMFSWDTIIQEANKSRTAAKRIPNAVGFLMQDRAIDAEAAKAACRDTARDCTQQFIGAMEGAKDSGLLSADVVRYLENLLFMVSGNAAWCQSCPRYNSRSTHSEGQLNRPISPSSADHIPRDMTGQPKMKPMAIHNDVGQSDEDTTLPWQYTAQSAEKDMISNLIDALRVWYKVPDQSACAIRRSVELIHVSSMMLDDIEEGLPLRRGRPAAHIVFGIPQTVKSSKLMTIKGIKELAKLGNARCMRILLEEIVKKASVGQKMDTHWTSTCLCPSPDDHVKALDRKSGALIRLIDKIMSAASPLDRPSKSSTHQFITVFARLYSLRADCPSPTFPDTTKTTLRAFYVSLDEGKYSLLLIHALDSLPEDQSLLLRGIMMQRRIVGRFMPEHKQFVLEMLKESRGFGYVAGLLREVQVEVLKALEEVEEQAGTDGGLRGLVEGVWTRGRSIAVI